MEKNMKTKYYKEEEEEEENRKEKKRKRQSCNTNIRYLIEKTQPAE
jgi:hypothetical protein